MAWCTVYKDANFDGKSWTLTKSVRDFRDLSDNFGSNLNDEVSSIEIKSGVWRFFEHVNFEGQFWELGPGKYNAVWDIGIKDNAISSAFLVSE